jgi:Flp pilus assembly protein TadG
MTSRTATRSIRHTACILSRLSDLRGDRRGVAAIEFAIIVPFMLALYVGGVELADGLAIQVKVTDTTHIIADLVTQQSAVTTPAAVATLLNASQATIAPYSASNLIVTVSEVSTDSNGNATVTWSQALNGPERLKGEKMTLPASLAGQANISLILGEVVYLYTPNLGYAITGTVNLSDSYYLFPRNSSSIACPTCT